MKTLTYTNPTLTLTLTLTLSLSLTLTLTLTLMEWKPTPILCGKYFRFDPVVYTFFFNGRMMRPGCSGHQDPYFVENTFALTRTYTHFVTSMPPPATCGTCAPWWRRWPPWSQTTPPCRSVCLSMYLFICLSVSSFVYFSSRLSVSYYDSMVANDFAM